MSMALFLLGYLSLTLLHVNSLIRSVKESTLFTVELHDDAKQEEVQKLQNQLAASEFAKPNSVAYVTKEEAAKAMKAELGDFSEDLGFNPLSNSIQFNIKAEFTEGPDTTSLNAILSNIQENAFVKEVYYDRSELSQARRNMGHITWILLGLALIFMIVSISLMDGSVRLMLYADRFLIRNMQLVGATREFILRPYLKRGLINGIVGGIIAASGIVFLWYVLNSIAPEIASLTETWMLLVVALWVILLGAAISTLSTWVGVNKYLKMRLDDLY